MIYDSHNRCSRYYFEADFLSFAIIKMPGFVFGFVFSSRKRKSRFYRAMLCIRNTSHGPVSVCLSVTSRSSTKTAKQRITQTTPHDSPGKLVFWRQRSPRNSTGVTPYGGHQMQVGWVKIGDFPQITGYISKTVRDRRMVSIKVE